MLAAVYSYVRTLHHLWLLIACRVESRMTLIAHSMAKDDLSDQTSESFS